MVIANASILERFIDPLARSLTPDAARVIVGFRADLETQARIDELAGKCTEGQLTPEERLEYEAYVEAIDMVAILQDKAREVLEHTPES
jgi:hypothetical protein